MIVSCLLINYCHNIKVVIHLHPNYIDLRTPGLPAFLLGGQPKNEAEANINYKNNGLQSHSAALITTLNSKTQTSNHYKLHSNRMIKTGKNRDFFV